MIMKTIVNVDNNECFHRQDPINIGIDTHAYGPTSDTRVYYHSYPVQCIHLQLANVVLSE